MTSSIYERVTVDPQSRHIEQRSIAAIVRRMAQVGGSGAEHKPHLRGR